jgi:hypothetical protein
LLAVLSASPAQWAWVQAIGDRSGQLGKSAAIPRTAFARLLTAASCISSDRDKTATQ